MDFLEDFDIDHEKVDRLANGGNSIDTSSPARQPRTEILEVKCPNENLRSAETDLINQVLLPDEFGNFLEDLDDAVLEEALQHLPGSLGSQDPSHGQCMSPFPYADDTVLDEHIQAAAIIDHQAVSQEKYNTEFSTHMGDYVPGEVYSSTERATTAQTLYDEEYMDSLDDAIFEEALYTEKDLKSCQLPVELSMSPQEDPLHQQLIKEAGRDFGQQSFIHEAIHGASMKLSNDISLACTSARVPDQESPEVLALSEALRYAYENDLTRDYLLPSFSVTRIFGPMVQSTIPRTKEDAFTDHSHLADVKIPNLVVLDKFKTLTITPRALMLIAEARLVQSDEAVQLLTEEVCNPNIFRPKKLELPILRSDNDRDMRAFQEQCLVRSLPLLSSIKEHRLPLYPQNLEDGEGMELSLQARAVLDLMMKESAQEKIGVTKSSLTYLVNQLRDDYTINDQMQYLISEIKYEKTPTMEKVTPPVSPKLIQKPATPSIDIARLSFPAEDSNSLLSDNFCAIEDIMLRDYQDVWSADTSPTRDFFMDSFTMSDQDAFLERPRQTLDDLKIEVPLMMYPRSQQSGPEETDAFQKFVDSVVDLDPEFERAVLHNISDDTVEEQLRERLEDAAQGALMSIEQEQLQAIDGVGRVPIPVMDFLIPEPTWKRLRGSDRSERSILKWIQAGKEQLFEAPSWPIDRAAGSKMVWSPLAHGASNVPVNEHMHEGESLLKGFLELPPSDEVSTSKACISHRGQPVAFVDDDRDEDIEVQLRRKQPASSLKIPLKKRSMDTEAGATPKRPRRDIPEQTSLGHTGQQAGPSLLPGDSPGASGSLLANFMELHVPKSRILKNSNPFATVQSNAQPISAPALLPLTKQANTQIVEQPVAGPKAPFPIIQQPAIALTVFISITIPRRMIRALESLISKLTLIERNYDSHNTFTWKPGSVTRTEVVPPLADDADITVSPSTGIIVTSMIRVRQKPRAGTNKGMVQIRVEKASLRYERLIVIVGGEGGKDDGVDVMSSSDSFALLELNGFASGLGCNVQVRYVGGGDKTLANWVATCICRYGLADPQILAGLIEPETLWEVFLRRAGFNVFAAQAISSQLKPPSDETNSVLSAQYGLGAFMKMTRDERMGRFGQLVGVRTLERVSRNVDELWNHG